MQFLSNQGLLGIAFFQASAFFILLVLFILLNRDLPARFFRLWLAGWGLFSLASALEVFLILNIGPDVRLVMLGCHVSAVLLFLAAILEYSVGGGWNVAQFGPLAAVCLLGAFYTERGGPRVFGQIGWNTSILLSFILVISGWIFWRKARTQRGHGALLLAGALWLKGIHGLDRPYWLDHPLFLLRVAFDHLLGVTLGVAMVVLVLEAARIRTEDLNDKLRRLTLITTASTQLLKVDEVLQKVLGQLVESLNASHALVRLISGADESAELVLRASVGFSDAFKEKHAGVSINEPWARRVLEAECSLLTMEEEFDPLVRKKMTEDGIAAMVLVPLPGKEGPLGVLAIGEKKHRTFHQEEITFIVNVGNLLGLTIQNVHLFEQAATVQRQWAYTFDSIQDPILVHDENGQILRANQRLARLLGREVTSIVGRHVADILEHSGQPWLTCPYCEGTAGEGDDLDPWLKGFFLASNSSFNDPSGRKLGTVHALKDVTERKRAEEKYRNLIANLQEGVFISTPQGRYLDFNEAFMRMLGYENRDELMAIDIGQTLYVVPQDRERQKKLLQEHGAVEDFEFQLRRKDGEILTVVESSIATRDSTGTVTAFQGFMLDISERKRAEQEVRRRNRELMVLNSIGQTLSQALELPDLLGRSLRQATELFGLDMASIYLLEEKTGMVRRVAAVGHHSDYMRHFPSTVIQPDLLNHIRAVHATVLAAQGLPLPPIFRDLLQKENVLAAHIVMLWSKNRMVGCLLVGSRTLREFTPADLNLLAAAGTQFAAAIEKSLLYEEARQAYENVRRAQEQLLQSEKMAAVGQLISGVAHELNNPLTAILGYSQLLSSSCEISARGAEYLEKLHKQAQRTHRIVQNLLSFARQQKPERLPVNLNQILDDTLALREYDLRINNIQIHRDLAPNLPLTAADPHQLQQVFLNILNNAVDAVLGKNQKGEIWIRSGLESRSLVVEFTDSGPGVQDPSRVFDPFYTTKPVGKGTGLGLSICYGIVTEHGGTVQVRNSPPRGATFAVKLPLHFATPASEQSLIGSADKVYKGRVLLVDDEEEILNLEREILLARGFSILIARNGREAQQCLEKETVDLVVTDLKMPGAMSGRDLYDWIVRRYPDMANRIVFTTSNVNSEELNDLNPESGYGVVQKPFDVDTFTQAIQQILRQAGSPVRP